MNTTYFMNLIMGNVFKTKTTPAIPSKYYLGISKTAPTVSGTNVSEPSGGSYSRVEITGLSVPTNGLISNTTSISFPESTTNWGVITHYVIYDALTAGNLLMYGNLVSARTVEENTVLSIRTGDLDLQLSNES